MFSFEASGLDNKFYENFEKMYSNLISAVQQERNSLLTLFS